MTCPVCQALATRVIRTNASALKIRRLRVCACGAETWTTETHDIAIKATPPAVIDANAIPEIPVGGRGGSVFGLSVSGSDPSPDLSQPIRQSSNTRSENLHSRLVAQFGKMWSAKYEAPYFPTPADKSQLGRLLQSLLPEAVGLLPRAWGNYLADNDQWIAQTRRHSLMEFCNQGISKYLTQAPVTTRRETATARAGQQWLDMAEGKNGRR